MDPNPEMFAFVLYLDSLVAESHDREVTPLRQIPNTLNQLYMQAMRDHTRRSALLHRCGAEWASIPDWRLDRQVIRVGLCLRERFGVETGDRIALVSELRPQWLIADLATLGLGAVSLALDPRLPRDQLGAMLNDADPRVTFASAAALELLTSHDGGAMRAGQLVALDPAPISGAIPSLGEILELGGTLDTPERAQTFRADSREVPSDRPAVRHYRRGPDGGLERVELTQGEVISRLREGWLRHPARPGDVAYVSDPTVGLAPRLALYAFVGDGHSTTALAQPGQELSDLAALHPHKIVAPSAVLAEAVHQALAHRARRVVTLGRSRWTRKAISGILGGQVRLIGSTGELDPADAKWLGTVAVVGPERQPSRGVS